MFVFVAGDCGGTIGPADFTAGIVGSIVAHHTPFKTPVHSWASTTPNSIAALEAGWSCLFVGLRGTELADGSVAYASSNRFHIPSEQTTGSAYPNNMDGPPQYVR